MQIDHDTNLNPQSRSDVFVFHGSGVSYFKIWIVNILLGILTLGIYSAWAKVRTKQYLYRNIEFNGAGFDYHARPLDILKSRVLLVVFFAFLVTAGVMQLPMWFIGPPLFILILPWLFWRSLRFEAEMTSYRDIRFGFSGRCSYLYFVFLALPLAILFCAAATAVMITFSNNLELLEEIVFMRLLGPVLVGMAVGAYLGIPYLHRRLASYYYNRHLFGGDRFKTRLDAFFYYGVFIKASILVGLMSLLLAGMSTVISFSVDWKSAVAQLKAAPVLAALLTVLVVLSMVFLIWVKAFFHVRCRNYEISRLHLQSTATFQSMMSVSKLFSIWLTNFLLLIVTLGFAWPWVKVRLARYRLEVISARLYGDLDQYFIELAGRQSPQSKALEELFDLNLDVRI